MWKSCHKIARAGSHRKGAPWPKRYSSDIARQFRLFCGSVGSSVGSGRPSSERALLARSALLDPADAPHPLRRPVVDRRALGLAMCGRATSVARRNGAAASGLPSTDIEGRVQSDRRRALSAPLKSKPLAYRAQPVACPGAQPGHGIGERALLRLTLMVREQRPTREAAMCGKCREHGSHTPQPSSAAAMGLAPQAARGPVVRPPWCVPGRSPGLPPAIALAHPRLCARTAVRWSAKPRFTSSTPGAYRP